MSDILDLVGAIFLLLGAVLCLGAAITLVRFPDVIAKVHGITKPQVLGMLCITAGITISLRTWQAITICALIAVMQLITAPVAGTMVGRSAYRNGLVDQDHLVVDELAADLSEAGFDQSR